MTCRALSEQIDSKLGHTIRECRLKAGVTLGELSAKTGFPPQMLTRFESGLIHVPAGVAFVIAARLGCDFMQLMTSATGQDLDPASDKAAHLQRTLEVLSGQLKASRLGGENPDSPGAYPEVA